MTTEEELAELRSDLDDLLQVAEGDGVEAAKSHSIRTLMASNRSLRERLAVFEQSVTPTNDELAGELSNFLFSVYEHGSQPNALKEARAILAFLDSRRPVQGEPSDAPTVQFMARKGGKVQALIDSLLAQANERGIHIEVVYPQGEPTDTDLLAASNAYMHYRPPYDDLSAFSVEFLEDMRAALRAAFATEQGENR